MRFDEIKQRLDPACWDNKKIGNPKTKIKGGVRVNNCVPKESVEEGRGDLGKALGQMGGSWSGWYKDESSNPNMETYWYDDGEGGHDASGTIEHNLQTGQVTVDYNGDEYHGGDVQGTFNNIGDALTALRGMKLSKSTKAPNYDRLGYRASPGPDDLRKTDRTGRKGTIGGGFANNLKGSIQANKGKLGPKGVLPEVKRGNVPDNSVIWRDEQDNSRVYHKGDAGYEAAKKAREEQKKRLAKKGDGKLKEQGVAEGSIEKTATGLKHHGDFPDYPSGRGQQFQADTDRLSKGKTGRLDKAFGVHWEPTNKRKEIVGDPTGVDEDYNPEYDDEAGMAQGSLHTLQNAVAGLQDVIDSGDNLPEWCQEKISLAEDYLVTVWDYIQSEKAQGIDPKISEEFDLVESIINRIAAQNGVDAEMVWEDLESLSNDELYAFAVTSQLNEDWSKVNKKDKTDGMSQKAVNAYRRENPGSKLKTAVTTKPSKLKKGSKASKRRKSYCSRSKGQMNMHNISCAKTPDKAICKARRRWNC